MQWINDETLQAICRTFLHSLWQGMIAAILAGLVLVSTRRTAARTRYNLLGGILLLSLLAAGFTFYLESDATPASRPASGDQYIIVATPSASSSTSHPGDILLQYMNEHAALIMLAWLIVFMFKCCRLMNGFLHIRRIRQEALPVAAEWKEQMLRLSQQLGIFQTVRLMETARAQVPFTLGFLKPCIYVPLGLLAQLPADQVETILLHELAHIRRKDYLVNILQNFSDTIFFFNPAMLWISSLLREEREACCDDIVVEHTPHQKSYLYALVAFQERATGVQPGMALLGKQDHLLSRVKRLLTRENKKLGIMEKSILMLGIMAITAFSFMPVQDNHVLDKASKDSINPVWLSERISRDPSLAADITAENIVCDTIPANKTKKLRVDTVYLSPRKVLKLDKPEKSEEKARVEYIVLDDLKKDSSFQFKTKFVYHLDSTRVNINTSANMNVNVLHIDSSSTFRLDTTHIYRIEKDSVKLIYARPQLKSVVLYTPQAMQVVQPKPAPKPAKIKVIQFTPAPVSAPKPVPAVSPKPPKKPSKYEPVLPAALLKTMNIGKPEIEC
jgi:beta-lactamase regulating signal transducer with metallopeptidase domain